MMTANTANHWRVLERLSVLPDLAPPDQGHVFSQSRLIEALVSLSGGLGGCEKKARQGRKQKNRHS